MPVASTRYIHAALRWNVRQFLWANWRQMTRNLQPLPRQRSTWKCKGEIVTPLDKLKQTFSKNCSTFDWHIPVCRRASAGNQTRHSGAKLYIHQTMQIILAGQWYIRTKYNVYVILHKYFEYFCHCMTFSGSPLYHSFPRLLFPIQWLWETTK